MTSNTKLLDSPITTSRYSILLTVGITDRYNFQVELTIQGWTKFGTRIQPGILSLVREFFANATWGWDKVVILRCVKISYDGEDIRAVIETFIVEQDEYGQYIAAKSMAILLSLDFSVEKRFIRRVGLQVVEYVAEIFAPGFILGIAAGATCAYSTNDRDNVVFGEECCLGRGNAISKLLRGRPSMESLMREFKKIDFVGSYTLTLIGEETCPGMALVCVEMDLTKPRLGQVLWVLKITMIQSHANGEKVDAPAGFALSFGFVSNMEVELLMFLEGIHLCLDKHFAPIVVETDSQILRYMILAKSWVRWSLHAIISHAKYLMSLCSVHIVHIFRVANIVANALARYVSSFSDVALLFDHKISSFIDGLVRLLCVQKPSITLMD
ncbi:hypothetical protein ACH5RR_006748 [Cinchona calisaya]|uniref:RNase H type-1 domain-containing protein n=1 Tax=Cinchona calisaya TaxID=153742 RepID=A0ABD3APU4_9GENT